MNGARETRFVRRPWLGALTVFVLLSAVAELLLRLAPPQALRFAHDSRAVYRYHPRWRTDFVPDATAAIRWRVDEGWVLNFVVTTNASGFRWHDRTVDHPLVRAPGQRIVHTIGDSFTMGWGVDYEASYPALLQRDLGERSLVLNLGLNGYGAVGAVEKSALVGESFPPDVVVYLATENDYEDDDIAKRFSEMPAVVRGLLDTFDVLRRHSYLANVGHALRWWFYYRDVFASGAERAVPTSDDAITEMTDDGPDDALLGAASKVALQAYADRLRAEGVRLVVVAHGTGPVAADIARYCRAHDIEVHHIVVPAVWHLYREGHFNPEGNARVAAFIAGLILQNTKTSAADSTL